MRLVGFILRIYHDSRLPEGQNRKKSKVLQTVPEGHKGRKRLRISNNKMSEHHL